VTRANIVICCSLFALCSQ